MVRDAPPLETNEVRARDVWSTTLPRLRLAGRSLFRDRDRIGAYASREAAFEVATAAGADAGIVTACKSTVLNEIEKSVSWPDS